MSQEIDLRALASRLLRFGAWSNLAGGAFLCIYFLVTDASLPTRTDADDVFVRQEQRREANARRNMLGLGCLLGGILSWAGCFAIAKSSDDTAEMHAIIDKLTRQ